MALYVPQSRRRRNAAIVAAATLVGGLVVGYVAGRSAVPSVGSAVTSTIERADSLATELDRLPIEYEQAISGEGDSIDAGVLDPLESVASRLVSALDDAPWVGPDRREVVTDAVASVQLAARDAVPAAEFETIVADAAETIRTTFGVEP